MIELAALEEMFQSIRQDAKWNIDGPMLWGYFFTGKSAERLNAIKSRLERDGYRFVEIFDADVDEGVEPYQFLHVERVEVHSVASLHQRNSELYALADEYQVGDYDGMDVGPVEPSQYLGAEA